MKKFSNYIREKLIINKSDNYFADMPDNSGNCLCIIIPTKSHPEAKRIALYCYEYYKQDNNVFVGKSGYKNKYQLSDNGYYYNDTLNDNKYWVRVILFNDDALLFLNTLLKDITQEMDITEFVVSLEKAKTGAYECIDDYGKHYSKDDIQDMIDLIKH